MSTSGRAGLFTMDNGRFFGDLRGMPFTAKKRQQSGAIRLAFGRLDITSADMTSATVKTDVDIGICGVVSPSTVPIETVKASGYFTTWCNGEFISGMLTLGIQATGAYSGSNSGMSLNYMVLGYS